VRQLAGDAWGYGFEAGSKVQLAEKEAQLVFLTREKFESREAG
jgi:hypothetical protein